MPTHVTALFGDRHAARAAVEQLVQAGFPRDAISVVMSESTHEREFGLSSSEQSGIRAVRPTGVLGAIVSRLVALASSNGFALRAAGPLVGHLIRGWRGAPSAFSEALASAGLAHHEAHFLDQGVRSGSIVLAVRASHDRTQLATELLKLSGGSALHAA
jgi:hypothetical protein